MGIEGEICSKNGLKWEILTLYNYHLTLSVGLSYVDQDRPSIWPNIWYSNHFSIYQTIFAQGGKVRKFWFFLILPQN